MPQAAITRRRFITIAASGMAIAALGNVRAAWTRDIAPMRWRGSALGAQVSIDIHHPDPRAAMELVDASVHMVRRFERLFSLYRSDSAICELNRSGVLIAPEPDMVELLRAALRLSQLTDGAFDPTVQPLWQCCERHFARAGADAAGPPPRELAEALAKVGYAGLRVSDDRIALARHGASITLNGIAQGYATDRVVELLRRGGLSTTLVDIGEIRAIGARPDGTPWRIGLADADAAGRTFATIDLIDRAVATSSGSGFRFDRDGKFNHLFDPATGRSSARYRSVSVVAATATEADALSTAFSVMSEQHIAELVAARPGLEVVLSNAAGQLRTLRS
ncbi:MAG: FAD:protein FMN transferase [Rhodopseudomonas palustris]|nr:MAG: FAD:protein FMN transferase [Rhodopseudomonas palustris]